MRCAYLVYNPGAGRYPSGLLAERAGDVLRARGWVVQLHKAHSPDDITRLASESAAENCQAFFIVGGDGSINLAANGLAGTDTALGILPAGTANVFAQELGLPGLTWTRWMALEESAMRLANAQPHLVDLGECNGRKFLLWAGVGLDAFIVHRIEPRRPWEKHFAVMHYAASAAWNTGFWRGINLKVEVEGEQISGHFLLAVLSNIHLYAGGFAELSPEARLDDGVMDLWLFRGETLGDTVQHMLDVWSGRHLHSDTVLRYPCRSVVMEADSPLFVQLDGEPMVQNGPVKIAVQPKSLKILVPEHTPHSLFLKEYD